VHPEVAGVAGTGGGPGSNGSQLVEVVWFSAVGIDLGLGQSQLPVQYFPANLHP